MDFPINSDTISMGLPIVYIKGSSQVEFRERNGSVVECLTRDHRDAGLSLTGITALCLSFLSFSIYCQTLFRVLSAGVLCTLWVAG